MSMILDPVDSELPASLTEHAEEILYGVAEQMGILVTEAEAEALLSVLDGKEELSETANIVRLNRQSKMSAFVVRSALVIAQEKKDALFTKYAKAAELKRRIRALIVKKYSGQATITARRLLANAGKRNMVDITSPKAVGHPESR
jgi:hypothetical protein